MTGDRTLVFADFFFWRPGTPLQKSLQGLRRSLLYDILRRQSDLISAMLPETWEQASNASLFDRSHLTITEREIKLGFERLVQSEAAQRDYRFCFFIDGLDESEETPQFDYRSMIEMLKGWHTRAPGGIKICVSSRDENVFINNLDADRRLQLHEITRPDMERYVRARLSHLPQNETAKLVEKIASRADGIFLWVTLVTQDVRRQYEDGAGLEDMLNHINSWHRELNDLFEQLLASIRPMDRKRAYQVFAMVLRLAEPGYTGIRLTAESMLFLEQYSNDPEFSFLRTPKSNSYNLAAADADKRLNGWCRGLVRSGSYLHFTHRSVLEFLQQPHIREEMERELQEFDALAAISYISIYESGWDPVLLEVAIYLATLCFDLGDDSHSGILDFLATQYEEILTWPTRLPKTESEQCLRIGGDVSFVFSRYVGVLSDTGTAERADTTISSILLQSIAEGCQWYFLPRLTNEPRLTDHPCKIELIAAASIAYEGWPVLDFLFGHNLLTPDSRTNLAPLRPRTIAPPDGRDLTFWDYGLMHSLWCCLTGNFDSEDVANLLETFLEYGAEPQYQFSVHFKSKYYINVEYGTFRIEDTRGLSQSPHIRVRASWAHSRRYGVGRSRYNADIAAIARRREGYIYTPGVDSTRILRELPQQGQAPLVDGQE